MTISHSFYLRSRFSLIPVIMLAISLGPAHLSAQSAAQAAQARQQRENAEWEYIIRVADLYAQGGDNRLGSGVFSRLFQNIAHTSHQYRASFNLRPTSDRWAGEFVRTTLLYAARDIVAHSRYWHGIDRSGVTGDCSLVIGAAQGNPLGDALANPTLEGITAQVLDRRNERVRICQGVAKGLTHFDRHLKPWFKQYFTNSVNTAMVYGGTRRVETAISLLDADCLEHDYFLRTAVAPAFYRVDDLLGHNISIFASLYSQMEASSLRRETIHDALMKAVEQGYIITQQVSRIEYTTTCFRF